jgi:hypothetical protein
MGWTSTPVRVGSLEFSTPSYLPISTFPFPLIFVVASHFSHHCRRHWKGAPPNLSSFASLPLFKFQVSSKPCVWLFHLFSFESLASFKNERRTEKSEEENWYFLLLLLHFFFTSSLVKKICNTLRRGICCSQKNICVLKNQSFFFLVLFARSSHQHTFWKY